MPNVFPSIAPGCLVYHTHYVVLSTTTSYFYSSFIHLNFPQLFPLLSSSALLHVQTFCWFYTCPLNTGYIICKIQFKICGAFGSKSIKNFKIVTADH